jgi:hypothetical protein
VEKIPQVGGRRIGMLVDEEMAARRLAWIIRSAGAVAITQ